MVLIVYRESFTLYYKLGKRFRQEKRFQLPLDSARRPVARRASAFLRLIIGKRASHYRVVRRPFDLNSSPAFHLGRCQFHQKAGQSYPVFGGMIFQHFGELLRVANAYGLQRWPRPRVRHWFPLQDMKIRLLKFNTFPYTLSVSRNMIHPFCP